MGSDKNMGFLIGRSLQRQVDIDLQTVDDSYDLTLSSFLHDERFIS